MHDVHEIQIFGQLFKLILFMIEFFRNVYRCCNQQIGSAENCPECFNKFRKFIKQINVAYTGNGKKKNLFKSFALFQEYSKVTQRQTTFRFPCDLCHGAEILTMQKR